MSESEKAAYINSQAACALIKMEAMKAENQIAIAREEYPPNTRGDFETLIDEHGIGHNDVVGILGR